jgi:hypothetical protein
MVNAQVPTYLPRGYELVHHLDQYKKPEIVEAVTHFKKNRKVAYKHSSEILGNET